MLVRSPSAASSRFTRTGTSSHRCPPSHRAAALASVTLLAFSLSSSSASAAFTYAGTIQGTVSALELRPGFYDLGLTGVAVGDPVSIAFSAIRPEPGEFGSTAPGTLRIQLNNYIWLAAPRTFPVVLASVVSSRASQSAFSVNATADIHNAIGPYFAGIDGSFGFALTALPGRELFPGQDPTNFIDPFAGQGFDFTALASATGQMRASGIVTGSPRYVVQFSINSVTFIPEPAASLPVLLAATALLARRRR